MIIICQSRCIRCTQCTSLVGDVDNRDGCACVGTGDLQETSVPSAQFCYEPKTALKIIKSIKKYICQEFVIA